MKGKWAASTPIRHIPLEDTHTNCTNACTVVTVLVYCVEMADEDQHICALLECHPTLERFAIQWLAGHVHMHATEDCIKI